MSNILVLCSNWFPYIGGVATHIEQLIAIMPDHTFEILVNSPGHLPLKEHFSPNATVIRMGPRDLSLHHPGHEKLPKFLYPYVVASDLARVSRKNRHIRKSGCDILHCHGPVTEPNLAYLDNLFHTTFFSARLNMARFQGGRVITCHGLVSHYNHEATRREIKLLRQFQDIICVDRYIYEDIKNMEIPGRLHFIPNSVNVNMFSFKPLMPRESITVGYIGRLSVERGFSLVERFIRAKPDHVLMLLVIAGPEKKVRAIREMYESPTVRIHANVPPSRLPNLIQDMDILLNPVEFEGISRATLEAFACGRPAIMLDIGDRYPVVPGETGFLIKGNVKELLEIIDQVRDDKNLLPEMSKKAREIVEREFSNEVLVPKVRQIYEHLTGGG